MHRTSRSPLIGSIAFADALIGVAAAEAPAISPQMDTASDGRGAYRGERERTAAGIDFEN